jgi:hypothetical protein
MNGSVVGSNSKARLGIGTLEGANRNSCVLKCVESGP